MKRPYYNKYYNGKRRKIDYDDEFHTTTTGMAYSRHYDSQPIDNEKQFYNFGGVPYNPFLPDSYFGRYQTNNGVQPTLPSGYIPYDKIKKMKIKKVPYEKIKILEPSIGSERMKRKIRRQKAINLYYKQPNLSNIIKFKEDLLKKDKKRIQELQKQVSELQTGRRKVDKKIQKMQQLELNRIRNEFNRVSNDLKDNYITRDEFETYKELMTPYFDVRYKNAKDDWDVYNSFLSNMSKIKKPEPRSQGEKLLLERINNDIEYLEGLKQKKDEEMEKLHDEVQKYNVWITGLLDDIDKAEETGEYNSEEFRRKIVGGMDGQTPFSVYEYDELTPEQQEESKQLMRDIKRLEKQNSLKERSDMEVRADIYQKMVMGQVEAYRDDIKNYIAEVSVEFENLRRKLRENDANRKKVDDNLEQLFSNDKQMSDYLNKVASKLFDIDTQVTKWNRIFGKEGSVKKLGEVFPVFNEFYNQIVEEFKISSNKMDSERMTQFNQKIDLLARAINEVNNKQLQNDEMLKNINEQSGKRFLDLEQRSKLYIDSVGNNLAKQLGITKDELKKNLNDLSLSMSKMDDRYVSYNKLNERINELVDEYKIPELYNSIENYRVLNEQEIKKLEKDIYFKLNGIELNINEKQKNINDLGENLIGLHNQVKQLLGNIDGMNVHVNENRSALENLIKDIQNVKFVIDSNQKSYLLIHSLNHLF